MKCSSEFVYVISRVNCALGCVDILFTLLFLYCALRAQISCQRLTFTLCILQALSSIVGADLCANKYLLKNPQFCLCYFAIIEA